MTEPVQRLPDDEPLRTRAQWVDRRLRAEILVGTLRPGQRLLPSELAARLQVSPTPLREALFRLEADGLVESVPHRGTRVTPLSRRSLTQLYELRLLLEPLALRKAVARLGELDLAPVRASHARMVSLQDSSDVLLREEAHRAFHHLLLEGCDSAWLLSLTDSFSVHSSRYRLLTEASRGGQAAANAEHAALLAAFLAGDAERATELLSRHIERTLELVMFLPDVGD